MKEINGYLLVEVPENSNGFSIAYEYNPYCVWLFTKDRIPMPIGNLILPAKKVEIIGLAKDLTEEHWKGIVESQKTFGYKKYDAVDAEYQWTARALQSGHSLLKANNLNPETTLILKKIL